MDGGTKLDADSVRPGGLWLRANGERMSPARVAETLGAWHTREVHLARTFRECRGLSTAQIEDLYQETLLALLHRPYQNETHLRRGLHKGLKQRAWQLHRDERRRAEILAENAPAIHVLEAARSHEESPERSVVLHEDWLIAQEFLAELNADERRVFRLVSDGMKYNRIAKALDMPINEARSVTEACDRKLERFLKLHEAGRLCGYRASTIQALLTGQATSEELAERALAHLDACQHCRLEHATNARRLRSTFEGRAAALMPPLVAVRLGCLARLGLRVRGAVAQAPQLGAVGVRERAGMLLAGGGASAKLAAGIVTATVVAGSTVAVTHVLNHPAAHSPHPTHRSAVVAPPIATTVSLFHDTPAAPPEVAERLPHAPPTGIRGPGRVVSAHEARRVRPSTQREPGGFAYLGLSAPTPPKPSTPTPSVKQSGGGPFGP